VLNAAFTLRWCRKKSPTDASRRKDRSTYTALTAYASDGEPPLCWPDLPFLLSAAFHSRQPQLFQHVQGPLDFRRRFVPCEKLSYLTPAHTFRTRTQPCQNAVSDQVAEQAAKNEPSRIEAVPPHSQGGIQMFGAHLRRAIKQGIYTGNPYHLGFGSGGHSAEQSWLAFAQFRIDSAPQSPCRIITMKNGGIPRKIRCFFAGA
jgi:hypothetical protein